VRLGSLSAMFVPHVNSGANVLTALICHADGLKPTTVCHRAHSQGHALASVFQMNYVPGEAARMRQPTFVPNLPSMEISSTSCRLTIRASVASSPPQHLDRKPFRSQIKGNLACSPPKRRV
jgi:hypothetical protein